MNDRPRMLELAVLDELQEPLHGYEIRKQVARSVGPFRRVSFGSLYPALHRLADRGLIQVMPDPQTVKPNTTKRAAKRATQTKEANGRKARKTKTQPRRQVIYQITSLGQAYLEDALERASVDDESMPLTISMMSRATPTARQAILAQRRQRVLERQRAALEAQASADFWVSARGELDWQQSQMELDWLDTLVESDEYLAIDNTKQSTRSETRDNK